MQNRARIGPYEILAPLGAGGMGEVFRARDTRLEREIALKLLPAGVVIDEKRRRRLLQEARAASALTHPNIVAVYDVELDSERPYIASELVDGRRLSDEIDAGPIPVKRLLDLAVQIALALRAAHEAGIAHRDLKPDNVMVTRDGRIKVLDFGLARLDEPRSTAVASGPADPRQTVGLAGTPLYMSPEQARGAAGDYRSDQFAFGLMLYEMATGRHPFRRPTSGETLDAIVDEETPSIADLNPRIPASLRWAVERCLSKDPADRYTSTADLAKDVAAVKVRLNELGATPPAASGGVGSRAVAAAAALALVVAAAVTAFLLLEPVPPLPVRYDPLVTDAVFQSAPAWSPDGRTVAYVADVNGILQVFTRNAASSERLQVTASRFDCFDPFWSSDGRRIYYHSPHGYSRSGLWSVSAAAGQPEPLLENAARAAISPDGRTLAFLANDEPDRAGIIRQSLWFASADGSNARRYTEVPFGHRAFVDGFMRFSPDGSRLLLSVWGWSDDEVPVSVTTFWVIPLSGGAPYEVLPTVGGASRTAVAFDWMLDGRHIVAALWDERTPSTHLWSIDTFSGRREPLTSTPGSENRPAVNRHDGRVAFTTEEVDFDLLEIPLDGSAARVIQRTSRNELAPAVAPDGSRYFYVTDRRGTFEIWSGNRQDPLAERLVVGRDQFADVDDIWALGSLAVSPDGQRVAYQRYGRRSGYQIWLSPVTAAGPAVELSKGARYQDAPAWSPDGSWIAFVEWRGDTFRISRLRVGSDSAPVLVNDDVALYSRIDWSPDNRWILYEPLAGGLALVSPDGREKRVISDERWLAYGWTRDSRMVYGLREGDSPRRLLLAGIDIARGEERLVNPDLGGLSPAQQPVRGFSRTGAGFATSLANAKSAIYVLEGVVSPDTRWGRLTQRFRWAPEP